MIRFLLALPLIGYGLAHLSGFLASWTKGDVGYSNHPWIFSPSVLLSGTVASIVSTCRDHTLVEYGASGC